MRYLKTHLSLLTFFCSLHLFQADLNEVYFKNNNTAVSNGIWKLENDNIKLRLEVVALNMEKQNNSLTEINRNLQALQNNFEKLFDKVEQLQVSKGVISENNASLKTNLSETSTQDLVDVQNVSESDENLQLNHITEETNSIRAEVFFSDISGKEEPKWCLVNADKERMCSKRVLGNMCSDSETIDCVNNKCRVKNSIYGSQSFWVACDGEWTVIQRRINGSVNFERNWYDYKHGFGDLDGEFWIGLHKLHSLTTVNGPVKLKIHLQDFDDVVRTAIFDSFSVGNESSDYRLITLASHSGNAGDSLHWNRNEGFSTYDKDNDKNSAVNCASKLQGGWWHYICDLSRDISNLNGFYYDAGVMPKGKEGSGIFWKTFRGEKYSMKFVQMMIRAKNDN